jgi:hypothetical protein
MEIGDTHVWIRGIIHRLDKWEVGDLSNLDFVGVRRFGGAIGTRDSLCGGLLLSRMENRFRTVG